MELLRKSLSQLGLPANAIQLYLTSYKIGRSSVGKLAKSICMDRSSAYLAFSQLDRYGLMRSEDIRGVKEVWAAPPSTVAKLMQEEAEKLKLHGDQVIANLSELQGSYAAERERPVLQSFYGRDSLYRITEDILQSDTKDLRIITNQNAERKVFSATAHEDFIQTRIKNRIKAKVLASNTPEARLLKRFDKDELRETRIVSSLEALKIETYIYGDKVAVLGFNKDIFGFIVRSEEYAKLQTYMFDHVWDQQKP